MSSLFERLVNRRQAFDELLYERDKTPTPEQELLSRSRVNPPPAEVLSGQALNALLDDLRMTGAGASVTVDFDARGRTASGSVFNRPVAMVLEADAGRIRMVHICLGAARV